MKFLPKTQHDYEDEADRLVTVLKRWCALEDNVNQLEWELDRCRYPETAARPAPPPIRKPMALRRAEEGKPVVPEKKQGRKQSWTDRYQKVKSDREYYQHDTSRLDDRVQRLTMQVADCKASQEKASHEPVAEALDIDLEQVRKAFRKEQALAEEPGPEASEAPDEEALPLPIEPGRDRHDLKWLQEKRQVLQDEKEALARGLMALQDRVDEVAEHLNRREQELEAARDEVAFLQDQQEQNQKRFAALETLRELARRFLQGQRSFLFIHNDPQLDNALAGLVDYSLARLALALAAADEQGVRAMCLNLHAIANKLQTYNGKPNHGLEQALAVLSVLQEDAGSARPLPPSPERQGPEAKPFLVRLKYLRDLARLDLRPFYFFDDQNQIRGIG